MTVNTYTRLCGSNRLIKRSRGLSIHLFKSYYRWLHRNFFAYHSFSFWHISWNVFTNQYEKKIVFGVVDGLPHSHTNTKVWISVNSLIFYSSQIWLIPSFVSRNNLSYTFEIRALDVLLWAKIYLIINIIECTICSNIHNQ